MVDCKIYVLLLIRQETTMICLVMGKIYAFFSLNFFVGHIKSSPYLDLSQYRVIIISVKCFLMKFDVFVCFKN